MTSFKSASLTLVIFLSLGLSGCAGKPWLMERTNVDPKPLELVESRHITKKPLAELSQADIAMAADMYKRVGAGPVYVVVAHSETSKGSLETRTARIAADLRALGVDASDIVASTVPLTTDAPVALIAFDTLEARAPEGCLEMPGMHSETGQTSDFDYKLGCGVKKYFAKQVANPEDLKGVAGLGGENDGERAANAINNTTRSGEARPYLPSYVISSIGAGS
ncbi:MAG: hypothetical protein EBQ96_00285 [Proteobacteria bacterium]|nr:hypothetical protein [Pseudomonadota bacterium]